MADAQGANGSVVARSLNAVTSTGAGSALEYGYVRNNHSMQVLFTGGPTSMTTKIELSLDGVTWFTSTSQVTQADTTGKMVTVVDTPAKYIRANCTALSGGTSPTVTAFVAGV